jgi:membrane protein insertase Oxa1/YidC/SpoIIIJ
VSGPRLVGNVLALVVSAPISLYLYWRIMHAVEATEVMWLLWWVHIPVYLLIRVLTEVVTEYK